MNKVFYMTAMLLCKVSSWVSLMMMLGNNKDMLLWHLKNQFNNKLTKKLDREVPREEWIVLLVAEVDLDLEEELDPNQLRRERTTEDRHLGIRVAAIALSPIWTIPVTGMTELTTTWKTAWRMQKIQERWRAYTQSFVTCWNKIWEQLIMARRFSFMMSCWIWTSLVMSKNSEPNTNSPETDKEFHKWPYQAKRLEPWKINSQCQSKMTSNT